MKFVVLAVGFVCLNYIWFIIGLCDLLFSRYRVSSGIEYISTLLMQFVVFVGVCVDASFAMCACLMSIILGS